jgi:acetyl esterase/lipase
MASELCSRGLNCSILSIDYDLSPEARYPTALRQISAAYSYALSLGKPVVLFGDSAGGHLCLSLLRHIHIPHPHIQAIRNAQVPDLLVLVSPWVDLKNSGASVRRNAAYDCLDKPTLDRWSRQYMGSSGSLDVYTDHLNSKAVWEGVLPRRTLMIAGEFECFFSEIRELAGAMVDVSLSS